MLEGRLLRAWAKFRPLELLIVVDYSIGLSSSERAESKKNSFNPVASRYGSELDCLMSKRIVFYD